jgi:hypothetical protein
MQPEQPKLSPAQTAFSALSVVMSHRPFFESHEKHIQAHNALDFLLKFIRDKFDEEKAAGIVHINPNDLSASSQTSTENAA